MTPSMLLVSVWLCTTSLVTVSASQQLLVVLLDGFRWDYVEKLNLINFKRFYSQGARAEYVKNDFPTLSYPNYYSLMTGRHTETHGMTGNYMYDEVTHEYFLIGTNKEQYNAHWWDGGEPLWVTAVKQNTSSYMFYWPGCDVTILNTTPTYCDPYSHVPTLDDFRFALNQSLNLLANGTTNFAGVYHEQPDYVGHKHGPDSVELAETLHDVDIELGLVLDQVKVSRNVSLNLVIMSDHGMTNIDPSRVINITDVLNSEPGLYITVMDAGAIASVYVGNTSSEERAFNLLKNFHANMTVYRKADIPERYHYRHGKYVAEITCVADLGWVILQPLFPSFPMKNTTNFHGTHGYDNDEVNMRGIFYGTGPYFKPGSKVEYIRAVDPYNVMCAILNLKPAANNGSYERIAPLAVRIHGGNGHIMKPNHRLIQIFILVSILFMFLIY
ncbi:unnamed protein product [Lymnaea stagnalis]|uniref:glycerophosphocholine cholinephosphodiesterase n=1 Tax=Lymnaea stagnalis TaxID=6523 RepID=A0AAV2HB89_LYMST